MLVLVVASWLQTLSVDRASCCRINNSVSSTADLNSPSCSSVYNSASKIRPSDLSCSCKPVKTPFVSQCQSFNDVISQVIQINTIKGIVMCTNVMAHKSHIPSDSATFETQDCMAGNEQPSIHNWSPATEDKQKKTLIYAAAFVLNYSAARIIRTKNARTFCAN